MDLFLVFHQLHHFTTMIFMCVCVYAYVWYVCMCACSHVWMRVHSCHRAHVEDREQPWVSLHPSTLLRKYLCFTAVYTMSIQGSFWFCPPPSHCSSTDVCYHDQCYEGPNSDTHTCISFLPTKSSHQSYRPIIFLLRQEESTLQDKSHSVPCPWSF